MLNWLKKTIFGGSQSNVDQLSKEEIELLQKDLAILEELQPGLAERSLRYLVDGTDEDVLQQLKGLLKTGLTLRLAGCSNSTFPENAREFRKPLLLSDCVNKPNFLCRLSKFYEHAVGLGARLNHPILKSEAPWLEILLREFFPRLHGATTSTITHDSLLKLCELRGTSTDMVLRTALSEGLWVGKEFYELDGLVSSLETNEELLKSILTLDSIDDQVLRLKKLQLLKPKLTNHRKALITLATGSSKKVRQAAEALMKTLHAEDWLPGLKEESRTGNAEAVRLLSSLGGTEVREFLEELEGTNKGVSSAVEAALSSPQEPAKLELPECEDIDGSPLADELQPLLEQVIVQHNHRVNLIVNSGRSRYNPSPLPADALENCTQTLNGFEAGSEPEIRLHLYAYPEVRKAVTALLESPTLTLLQALRLAVLMGVLSFEATPKRWSYLYELKWLLETYREGRETKVTLVQIERALEHLGYNMPPLDKLHPFMQLGGDWSAEHIWPFYAGHIDALGLLLSHDEYWTREIALTKVVTFPEPPTTLRERLWEMALTGHKVERKLAREALEKMEGFEERLTTGLSHGKREVRESSALWLASLGRVMAVEELFKAARKEKSESTKAAILSALESMGESIDEFISLASLTAEAAKGMKKGLPSSLKWFDFESAPKLTLLSGAEVSDEVTQWLAVRAVKLKSPSPDPMLTRFAQLFSPAKSADFALYVLESFISEDQSSEQSKAVKAKGILSLAGAMGDGRVAPVVNRYLKKWYGNKLHQCKAMLAVLATSEALANLQLLLSVANRFRTKGLQKEAETLCQELATRKGWSTEELADRTVPAAGLGEDGTMTLDFGGRQFAVKIDSRLYLAVFDENGSQLKSLPKAGKKDDAELAKACHKQFKVAKKELKAVLTLQTERLREAMVVQRTWTFEDWRTYLEPHPVMGYLCTRLLWHYQESGKVFRPLGDGSLTDVEDEEVKIKDDQLITLAHRHHLTEDEANTWEQHLTDYEILPVFDQLQTPGVKLENPSATEFTEFQGFMVETFALRGQLSKVGFSRGDVEDGGWLEHFEKYFSTLDLTAEISFSGTCVPIENEPVALGTLSFRRSKKQMELGKVPPILLAECCADLRRVAENGTGFNPDWESL